jgi:hypothetical protein
MAWPDVSDKASSEVTESPGWTGNRDGPNTVDTIRPARYVIRLAGRAPLVGMSWNLSSTRRHRYEAKEKQSGFHPTSRERDLGLIFEDRPYSSIRAGHGAILG